MAQFEKRRQFQKILYSRAGVIVLVIVIIFLGFSVFSVFEKRHEASINRESAARELKTLTDREKHTKEEIARLNTEAGVEEAIRNKYRATKEGEGLVVIINKEESQNKDAVKVAKSSSFWQSILNFFGI